MKVRELIEKLKEFDGDLPVSVYIFDDQKQLDSDDIAVYGTPPRLVLG